MKFYKLFISIFLFLNLNCIGKVNFEYVKTLSGPTLIATGLLIGNCDAKISKEVNVLPKGRYHIDYEAKFKKIYNNYLKFGFINAITICLSNFYVENFKKPTMLLYFFLLGIFVKKMEIFAEEEINTEFRNRLATFGVIKGLLIGTGTGLSIVSLINKIFNLNTKSV